MNIASQDVPKIELYMFSLYQEFPFGTGHETYLDNEIDHLAWSGDWSNNWVQWHTNEQLDLHREADGEPPLAALRLRGEEFGGLAFDTSHDKVFRLNHAGFRLLSEWVEQARAGRLDHEALETSHRAGIAEFITFLRRAGLWAS